MWSANGHQATFPIARVQIKVDGEIYNVEAAVTLHLPEDMLLGMDVPLMKHIARRLREDEKELLAELQVQSRGASSLSSDHRVTGQNESLKRSQAQWIGINLREGSRDARIRWTKFCGKDTWTWL